MLVDIHRLNKNLYRTYLTNQTLQTVAWAGGVAMPKDGGGVIDSYENPKSH